MRRTLYLLISSLIIGLTAFSQKKKFSSPPPPFDKMVSRIIETVEYVDTTFIKDEKSGEIIWRFEDDYIFIKHSDSLIEVWSHIFFKSSLIESVGYEFDGQDLTSIEVSQTKSNPF